jgi:hypothetical protein
LVLTVLLAVLEELRSLLGVMLVAPEYPPSKCIAPVVVAPLAVTTKVVVALVLLVGQVVVVGVRVDPLAVVVVVVEAVPLSSIP